MHLVSAGVKEAKAHNSKGIDGNEPFAIGWGEEMSAALIGGAIMIDVTTQKRLQVSKDPGAGPYVVVPFEQIDDVRALLDNSTVRYWVDGMAISYNGSPEVIVVNTYRGTDTQTVQDILDGAP